MPVVRVSYPKGALTRAQKEQLSTELTEVVLDALALRVWVLIHEVREGSWGAAGGTVSALDVAQFLQPELDSGRRAEIGAAIASGAGASS